MTYYEYALQLRTEVSRELEFHMKKADAKSTVRKNLEGNTVKNVLPALEEEQ